MTPIATGMNPSRSPSATQMNFSQSRVPVLSTPRPPANPWGAGSTRAALPGRHSFRSGPLARERALSVIECELLVLTYHCDPQVRNAIKVDRAKWAPERSIPKHVQQDKIAARRAARRRAKRARRGSCALSLAVRACGQHDQLVARCGRLVADSKSDAVRPSGWRDRLGAGSKIDTFGQWESHARLQHESRPRLQHESQPRL